MMSEDVCTVTAGVHLACTKCLPYTRGQGCEMTTAMRKGYMKERTWKGHGGILRKEGRGTGERTDEDDEAPIE